MAEEKDIEQDKNEESKEEKKNIKNSFRVKRLTCLPKKKRPI